MTPELAQQHRPCVDRLYCSDNINFDSLRGSMADAAVPDQEQADWPIRHNLTETYLIWWNHPST